LNKFRKQKKQKSGTPELMQNEHSSFLSIKYMLLFMRTLFPNQWELPLLMKVIQCLLIQSF